MDMSPHRECSSDESFLFRRSFLIIAVMIRRGLFIERGLGMNACKHSSTGVTAERGPDRQPGGRRMQQRGKLESLVDAYLRATGSSYVIGLFDLNPPILDKPLPRRAEDERKELDSHGSAWDRASIKASPSSTAQHWSRDGCIVLRRRVQRGTMSLAEEPSFSQRTRTTSIIRVGGRVSTRQSGSPSFSITSGGGRGTESPWTPAAV